MTFHSYSQMISRISRHDDKVGKGRKPVVEQSRIVLSEAWRSGGGVIPKGTERATLVRRVVDLDFEGYGMVSRHGQRID